MAIELVTGWIGEDHITAAQEADLWRGIEGGTGRLNVGSQMMPTIMTANQISIADGLCLIDGRECYIGYGETVNVAIESGTQEQKRNDLVMLVYNKDADEGVETVEFQVLQGTPSEDDPVDPTYSNVDIRTGMYTSQKPFCRVRIDGVNIEGIDMLMDLLPSVSEVNASIMQNNYDGAGVHNSIYRGKYLGNTVTDEQWEEIKAGTFKDMYIGDYWTINGFNWVIADFDYWYKHGDTRCDDHHIVIVPSTMLYYDTYMNATNTTEGAYIGSYMYTTGLAEAKTMVNAAFGSGHILTHSDYFQNAVTSGYPSGGEWVNTQVDLMNEEMVYGSIIRQQSSSGGTNVNNATISKSQLALFRLNKEAIIAFGNGNNGGNSGSRYTWWLRDVVSAASFASVTYAGYSSNGSASNSFGVRPAFAIYSS